MADGTQTQAPALSPADQAFLDAYNAGKTGGGNSVAAPASQQWLLMPLAKGQQPMPAPAGMQTPAAPTGWQWVYNAGYQPKAPTATKDQVFGSQDTGYYMQTPTADNPYAVSLVVPAGAKNPDEEISKAIDRQNREAERTEKERNLALSGSYATDQELADRNVKVRQVGVNEGDLRRQWAVLDENQRQFDIKQKAQDLKDAQDILQSKAQTGYIDAQTSQIQQNLDIAGQKLPGELAQQQATRAGTEASTALTRAQIDKYNQDLQAGKAPVLQGGLTNPYLTQVNPLSGAVDQSQMNLAYQPKTQAEIAARVGQINAAAQAKQNELLAKVDGQNYTNEHAVADFKQWWGQNVQPQMGALEAAQQEAQFARTTAEQTARQQNYQTAIQAGNLGVNAFTAMQANRVGANWDQASAAASKGDFAALGAIPDSVTYRAPDISQTYQQGVMEALKYISPTAAQATGASMPNYSAINIPQALSPNQYQLWGGAPQPAPVPAAAAVPAPAAPIVAPYETSAQSIARNQAAQASLLPPGYAGMPELDPRFAGQLNPYLNSTYVYGGV